MNNTVTILKGLWGGIFIAVGALVFLSLYPSPIGALLFSIGLMMIFILRLKLYTGVVAQLSFLNIDEICLVFLANLIGCSVLFLLPQNITATILINNKLMLSDDIIFVRAIFCGIIITSAVLCYQKNYAWMTFALIPAFILASFEHSIANICLVITGRVFNFNALKMIFISALGNCCGSVCLYRSFKFI